MPPLSRTRSGEDSPVRPDSDASFPSSAELSAPADRDPVAVLDPVTALRRPGERLHPTAYVVDRLLLPATLDEQARDVVVAWLDAAGGDEVSAGLEDAERAGRRVHARLPDAVGTERAYGALGVDLRPAAHAVAAPDAWTVLQRARAAHPGERLLEQVQLDHVLRAHGRIGSTPFHRTAFEQTPFHRTPFHRTPYSSADGSSVSGYAVPGSGGRQPVLWIGDRPNRRRVRRRRPVVAVLDTGCGVHPWWDDANDPRPDAAAIVSEDLRLDGVRVGLVDTDTEGGDTENGDSEGDTEGPLDGSLDALSGHGTFICGLVHQVCPDADIISVPVVHPDGVIIESDLLDALAQVAELAQRHAHGRSDGRAIDVLNLSMGYYHENASDRAVDPLLLELLDAIGRAGTTVVTSAGNDATMRPMYPAAFSRLQRGRSRHARASAPVVAVGAENPDGTVALFSNAGEHVQVWAPGAALVSTMPITFDGGAEPSGMTVAGRRRASLDPDDFSGGFGVWSGTSFAAPVVAARIARNLLKASESGEHRLLARDKGPQGVVERAWAALDRTLRPEH